MCGNVCNENTRIIDSSYKFMDEEMLLGRTRGLRDDANLQIESLNALISCLL